MSEQKNKLLHRGIETAIIATLGPATSSKKAIRAMVMEGANFFRLNFSHSTYAQARSYVGKIREVEKDLGVKLGIIADLQGPKLRIGTFLSKDGIALHKGMRIRFDLDPAPGNEKRVNFPHPEIIRALKPGAKFLMDDGNVGMEVTKTGNDFIEATVLYGDTLSSKKGVNVPSLSRPVSTLTPKDRKDLDFALALGVNWIAQSFVQSVDDVREARMIIGDQAGLMAKIEKPAAVRNFSKILHEVDAVMIARGDLGVEIPAEQVPAVQKVMTYEALLAGKPVAIATQMLDSMIRNPRPTRAEVSDVAQAVFDGASAVMLSGETAMGRHPIRAVRMMRKICYEMENGKIFSLALRAQAKTRQAGGHRASPLNVRIVKSRRQRSRRDRKQALKP